MRQLAAILVASALVGVGPGGVSVRAEEPAAELRLNTFTFVFVADSAELKSMSNTALMSFDNSSAAGRRGPS